MKSLNYDVKLSENSSIHLDFIRALSAQLIVISHGLEGYLNIQKLHSAGASGLTFLFLISGMLIGHSIFTKIKNKEYGFKNFFISRFSRIYSLFLLILLFIALIDGYHFLIVYNDIPFTYNIPTFVLNLLMLNGSLLGYPFFGSSGQLWTLPIFWWNYMLLGWILLGKRTTKNKILYYTVIILFSFILIFETFGYQSQKKITANVVWYFGVGFAYLMNKINNRIRRKSSEKNHDNRKSPRKVKLVFSCLFLSIILFILALFILSTHHNAFALDYSLLLASSFCFFLILSQYTYYRYPKPIKKVIRFMASYSFTLYLIHVSIFHLYKIFLNEMDGALLFLIVYIIVNIISILIASFSEMQTSKIKEFLLTKLKKN